MELLQTIYPFIVGAVMRPIITYLKGVIKTDVPVLWYFITLMLNAIVIFGIALLTNPTLNGVGLDTLMAFLMAQVTSQGAHALKKTGSKLLIGEVKE